MAEVSNRVSPGLFVPTEFQIDFKTYGVDAFVDTGNTFFNCVSEKACHQLGVELSQLAPPPTKAVRQAGGGATLEVLGMLPDTSIDGFKFKELPKLFAFSNTFVLRGLNHDFNISLTFLKKHLLNIDFKTNSLHYHNGSQVVQIPFLPKQNQVVSLQPITPKVPRSGITVGPKQ